MLYSFVGDKTLVAFKLINIPAIGQPQGIAPTSLRLCERFIPKMECQYQE